MLTINYQVNGEDFKCSNKKAERSFEAISAMVDIILSKNPISIIVIDDKDNDIKEVLDKKGVKYMLNKKQENVQNEEPTKTIEEQKREIVEGAMDPNITDEEFDKRMRELMKVTAQEIAMQNEEEYRKATIEEERKLQQDLLMLEGDINRSFKLIGNSAVSQVLNSTPNAAYYILLSKMNKRIKDLEALTNGEENKASSNLKKLKEAIEDKAYNVEECYSTFTNIIAKLGLLIIKLASVFLGLSKFVLDVAVTAVVLIVRVGVSVTKEVFGAGRNVGRSFKKNVMKKQDAFVVDYVTEESLKEAIDKTNAQLKMYQDRLDEIQSESNNEEE